MSEALQDCGEEGGEASAGVLRVLRQCPLSGCLFLGALAPSDFSQSLPPAPRILQRAHKGGSEEPKAGKHVPRRLPG